MAALNDIPDDLLIDAADEIRIRQDLVLTALGRIDPVSYTHLTLPTNREV